MRVLVLRRDRFHRKRIKIEPPEKLVDLDRAWSEKFGEAALRRPAQHQHLPEPVLGMGEAEPEIDIRVVGPENMRHAGVIADNLDRPGNAFDSKRFAVIGDRAREKPVKQKTERQRQKYKPRGDADQPAKQTNHTSLIDCG